MMYHRHDYGSVVWRFPAQGFAVDVEVRGDNSGPHSMKEIGRDLCEAPEPVSWRKESKPQL